MVKWKKCKVADLGTVVGGATPSTKDPDNYEGGSIPWITPKDLSNYSDRYISRGERNITEKGLNRCSAKLMPRHSILFTSRAPIGYIAIAETEVCTNQGFKSVVPNNHTDYLFLYYLLKYNKDKIKGLGSGTTFKEVSGSTMRGIPVTVPESIEIQKAIGKYLDTIDAKIEINKKISKNLEKQAATFFKHLFIDNASPTWKEGTISDLGKVVGGGTPSKAKPEYYTDNGIAWITPKDLSVDKSKFISHGAEDITALGLRNSSATIMPAGTVLFSSRAPIGYIAIADGDVSTNQGFKSVIPFDNIGTAYVYFFLKKALPIIENIASGSTFKEISGSAMRAVPALIPDDDSLLKFSIFCEPLFHQQRVLETENRSLASLRDSILPKLMSGELDISSMNM